MPEKLIEHTPALSKANYQNQSNGYTADGPERENNADKKDNVQTEKKIAREV